MVTQCTHHVAKSPMAAQNANPPQINPPPVLHIPPRQPIQANPDQSSSQPDSFVDPNCFKVVIMQCTASLHSGAASVTLDRQRRQWSSLPNTFVTSALSAASNCPIQRFILKHHKLDTLPSNFSSSTVMLPTTLITLDLSHNCFVSVPAVICNLVNLQELYLNNNKIVSIPNKLSDLVHLQSLHLQNNQLRHLPIGVCGLVSMKCLNIEQNELKTLPSEISQLINLEILHASLNELEYLPDSLTSLTNLQELHLSQNQLSDLPNKLDGLTSLCQLHLASNKLVFLPLSFVNLKSLKSFTISGNSLKFPPLSACRNGVEHLRAFMMSKYQSEQWNSKEDSCSVCNNLYFDSDSGEDTPFEEMGD